MRGKLNADLKWLLNGPESRSYNIVMQIGGNLQYNATYHTTMGENGCMSIYA